MEQSFWFDGVPFDKKDYPVCELEYTDIIDRKSSLFDDYNLLDYIYGTNRYIRLSELFKADSKEKWDKIRKKARECDSITILDDISIENREIDFIANFYLGTFYAALKAENPNCFVFDMKRHPA